jgi:hypothetical protein
VNGQRHILIIAAALLGGAASAGAACVPVAVAPEQAVRGGTIVLADLLPACASASVLAASGTIPLGAAPNAGAVRVFRRAEILRAIERGGMDTRAWRVPEEIEVRRASRGVSRDEVFHVVRDALARQGLSGAESLLPGDVRLSARVEVLEDGGGLELMQMEMDPVLARGKFLLRQRKTLLAPPVVVMANLREPLLSQLRGPKSMSARSARAAVTAAPVRTRMQTPLRTPVRAAASGPVLVRSGQTAHVQLISRGFAMQGDAVALESGRLGETIRVRFAETGKILRAQVRRENYLEASF